MRVTLVAAALSFAFVLLPVNAQAVMRHYQLDIPRQPLDSALKDFARQTGLQVARFSDRVDGSALVGPVNGDFSADDALKSLLDPQGLRYKMVNERTIVVVKPGEAKATGATAAASSEARQANSQEGAESNSFRERFRLAQTTPEPAQSAASVEATPDSLVLEEVVVTAQKRAENLLEVPVPVTAINAQDLVADNKLRLRDYYSSVPGLSISSNNLADSNLSIRGVTTGGLTNPTVGVTVDDVPFGSTTALGSRTAAPDIDPSDLARIEVLRGPQGTLYGASSLGGLLKYVTVDPSTAALTGRLEADLNSVHNGDNNLGFGFRGGANIPVGDSFAIRVSGFTRRDAGYVDNPSLNASGVNRVHAEGARIAALWKLSDAWYLKLSALYQDTSAAGASYVAYVPALHDLQQSLLGGTGGYNHQIRSLSATIGGTFAGIDVIAISGYNIDTYHGTNDLSGYYGSLADAVYGVGGVTQYQHARTRKFTQEVRLTGKLSDRLDWLVGGFYTHEDTPTNDFYAAVDPVTLASPGAIYDDAYPTTYSEWAAFADLTIHFTPAFDVQFGGRESQNRQRYEETYSGGVFGTTPAYNPPEYTRDHSFTYLVTPRYKLSSNHDLMVYARLASGYRPGGPNPTCVLYPVPCQYAPDKTRNYELGLKGATAQHLLEFDASLYYIDWQAIQLQVAQADGSTYFTNASSARSQGIELSSKLRPTRGLTLAGWIALNDAHLTTALPASSPVIGDSGNRLPFSSRFSGNLSLQYERRLSAHLAAFGGGSLSYVGDREDVFEPAGTSRFHLPGYAQADLHVGIRADEWTVSLFANNIADRRGLLSTGQIGPETWVANYIQPRTVGLSASKTFE